MENEAFKEWGILEVMGRLKMAWTISEQTIAGAGMIRIDVPETKSAPAFTRFFSPGSIYSITPTSEEIAHHLAEQWREVPVSRFELPKLPASTPTPEEDHFPQWPHIEGGIEEIETDDEEDEEETGKAEPEF